MRSAEDLERAIVLLEMTVDVTQRKHFLSAKQIWKLGLAMEQKQSVSRSLGDFTRVICVYDEIIASTDVDNPEYIQCLSSKANARLRRQQLGGEIEDLNMAIDCSKRDVSLIDDDDRKTRT